MTASDASTARARVDRLIEAARRVADPRDALGIEARAVLPRVTGLSPQGVELGLVRCLEIAPSEAEIGALLASVEPAPAAHVLLSANVFIAAHRAIALALAASERVLVRPSRREPEMALLLARGAPGLFQVASELSPAPGDHVFAYGSDETLSKVRAGLPPGVTLHAHGTGLGLVVVDLLALGESELDDCAVRLARDVILFDQRGCLSPRVAAVLGPAEEARRFASALAAALAHQETIVPLGRLSGDEAEQVTRYRDSIRYAAEIFPAGRGWVGLDRTSGLLLVPPPGRNVHVVRMDGLDGLAPLRGRVASFATHGAARLGRDLASLFPGARPSMIGEMQAPAFDGPVERRGLALLGTR